MALQLRRGSNTQRATIVFSEGELVYTTDTKKLWIGDGVTQGGVPVDTLSFSNSLSQDLDLNNNSIVGSGDISIDGAVESTTANIGTITVNQITNSTGIYTFKNSINESRNQIHVSSENRSGDVKLSLKTNIDAFSVEAVYGRILFERDDVNGKIVTSEIRGGNTFISFSTSNTGDTSTSANTLIWKESKLGVGTSAPVQALDVNGNAVVSGYLQFGRLTTQQRDQLSVINGSVIYNTTVNRFQGYQNGSWINLDNGSQA